jgi:uncharacterized OB-fold protein
MVNMVTSGAERRLPRLNDLNRDFWTGGAVGQLRIYKCRACSTWVHPPNVMCSVCLSRDVGPEPTSGRGTVFSYTRNLQRWTPNLTVPYTIALVELPEQEGLRLITNIIGTPPEDVYIGMRVHVTFEQQGDYFVPLFEPD